MRPPSEADRAIAEALVAVYGLPPGETTERVTERVAAIDAGSGSEEGTREDRIADWALRRGRGTDSGRALAYLYLALSWDLPAPLWPLREVLDRERLAWVGGAFGDWLDGQWNGSYADTVATEWPGIAKVLRAAGAAMMRG